MDVHQPAQTHVLHRVQLRRVKSVAQLTIVIRARPLALPLSRQLCLKCFWLFHLDYSILYSRIIG
jgi:hypothetical protein